MALLAMRVGSGASPTVTMTPLFISCPKVCTSKPKVPNFCHTPPWIRSANNGQRTTDYGQNVSLLHFCIVFQKTGQNANPSSPMLCNSTVLIRSDKTTSIHDRPLHPPPASCRVRLLATDHGRRTPDWNALPTSAPLFILRFKPKGLPPRGRSAPTPNHLLRRARTRCRVSVHGSDHCPDMPGHRHRAKPR
jgi:hypothetical protein